MHAAYAPYARWLARDGSPPLDVATLEAYALNAAADAGLDAAIAVRFAVARERLGALAYERQVAASRVVPLREGSPHDAWNALAWLRFPRTKMALNALHVTEADARTANRRNLWRDRATLIDESGLLVACDDASLLAHWSRHEWLAAFSRGSDADADRRRIGACAIGHGLLTKLAAPYRALTAHAMVLPLAANASLATVDCAAARLIDARDFTIRPIPVAALPGWDSEALGDALFDDRWVFRPLVRQSAQTCAT